MDSKNALESPTAQVDKHETDEIVDESPDSDKEEMKDQSPTMLPLKRERKSTSVLTVDTFDESKKPIDFDVPKGTGTALQDLDCVNDSITSKNTKDHQIILDAFHKFLFSGQPLKLRGQKKVPPKTAQTQILQYSGFRGLEGFDQDTDEIKDRYEDKCNSATIPLLKTFCDLLCLDRSGCTTKVALTERLLEFLESPSESKIKQSYVNALKKKRKSSDSVAKTEPKSNKKKKKEENADDSEDEMASNNERDADEEDVEEIEGISFPTEKWIRKWVRAYLTCFNTDNVTTKHAIATASEKFGVDFNVKEKKKQLKEMISEEIEKVVNWKP